MPATGAVLDWIPVGADELPPGAAELLTAVFEGALRGEPAEDRAVEVRDNDEPFAVYGGGDDAVMFHGQALADAEALVNALAGSALADGGYAPDSLRRHIAGACRANTAEEAHQRLAEVLAADETEYMYAEPLRTHFNGPGPATIGRCQVHQSLANVIGHVDGFHADRFPARVITATVKARDEPSAYVRALDCIDEAKAILQLANERSENHKRRATMWLANEQQTWTMGGEGFTTAASAPNELLTWPYLDLSAAAAKPPTERTDLERRALGATRWHYEATTATWPTAALTAAMSALETLLLPPGVSQGKGSKLAARLRDLGAKPWAPAGTKFTTWFSTLYINRNDATHEGISYEQDANVRRLLSLTHTTIHWACHHLFRFHASTHDGTACTTLDEALAAHH